MIPLVSRINSFQACHWDNKIIIVTELASIYNIFILKTQQENFQREPIVLTPIQKLRKHGQSQGISFLHHMNNVYCLFASTYSEENR